MIPSPATASQGTDPYQLTLEELQDAELNLEVVKEGYAHVEKRLNDVLDVRKTVEQKALTLFSAYVTVSLALFGFALNFLKDGSAGLIRALPFMVSGAIFLGGAGIFMAAIRGAEYGFTGSDPRVWLRKGTTDGDAKALARTLATVIHFHQKRIDVSLASNLTKGRLVQRGMLIGLVATASLLITFLVTTLR